VQTIIPVMTGGALKFTAATYQTANKREINGIGVIPDYEIGNRRVLFDENPDVTEMEFSILIDENATPTAINAVKQRLSYFGYYLGDGAMDTWDAVTEEAIACYQRDNGLDQTGKADIYTQMALNDAVQGKYTTLDMQMDKAIELLMPAQDKAA